MKKKITSRIILEKRNQKLQSKWYKNLDINMQMTRAYLIVQRALAKVTLKSSCRQTLNAKLYNTRYIIE